MKPSLLSTSRTLSRSREAGVDTLDLFRICALWMRAIISPSGSFIAIIGSLPARLDETRDQSFGAEIAQCDARQLQLAIEPSRPARHLASIAHPRLRRIARQLGKFQRRCKPFFHRLAFVARDRFESTTPPRVLLAQSSSSVVLLN